MKGIDFLTVEDVLRIHLDQIGRHGGSPGIRDNGLLESAVAMPRAGFGGQYFHPELPDMGAAYLFHLVKNHPFVDGNKRVGLAACIVFLDLNQFRWSATNEEAARLTLGVADGSVSKSGVGEFLRKHARKR